MFNNSTALPTITTEAPPPDDWFDKQLYCLIEYLHNKTVSYDQAKSACSMYTYPEELTTGIKVIYWLTAILTIIPNSAILWGIVGTRKLHKPLFFYLANLAVTDFLASIGLLCRSATWEGLGEGVAELYTLMNILTLFVYSQVMSASALALMSIDSYVAIRHPIYFHTHAHSAKRNAGISIAFSWIVLTLLTFSPSMGWNCLDLDIAISECFLFYSRPFIGLVSAIILLLVSIMLFTNTSVYVTIKQRQKNRLGQPGEVQPLQGNNPAQTVAGNVQPQNVAQNDADRKFQKSVQKARTVLIHVVVACIFLIAPLAIGPLCKSLAEKCPLPGGPHLSLELLAFNSVINPIVSITCRKDLRGAIWENIKTIHRALLTMMRGNRVNPQDEQPARGNVLELQAAAEGGSTQNTPATQPTEGHGKTDVNRVVERPETDSFKTKSGNLAIIEIR